jgi:hypothetical protein
MINIEIISNDSSSYKIKITGDYEGVTYLDALNDAEAIQKATVFAQDEINKKLPPSQDQIDFETTRTTKLQAWHDWRYQNFEDSGSGNTGYTLKMRESDVAAFQAQIVSLRLLEDENEITPTDIVPIRVVDPNNPTGELLDVFPQYSVWKGLMARYIGHVTPRIMSKHNIAIHNAQNQTEIDAITW